MLHDREYSTHRPANTTGWCFAYFLSSTIKGSLVQRELSAKLTEGLSYHCVNISTDSSEVLLHFAIGDANDP